MLSWFGLFALVGAGGTWFARRYALQRQLLDQPGERRSHSVATPRGGGIGVVAAILVAGLSLAVRVPAQAVVWGAVCAGLLMVAAAGWLDDHRPVSPWWRLATHVLAAGIFAAAVWTATGGAVLPTMAATLAVVTLVNVWNFMDGINGLAASQAMIVAATVGFVAAGPLAAAAWATAGACLGFLPFNFPRARIFLGDVGSGAIGFAMAALLALAMVGESPASEQWPEQWSGPDRLLLVLPMAPFLVDSALTLGRRVLRRERWWTPHTQHAYQVWARASGHPPVTLAYAVVSAAGAAAALLLAQAHAAVMLGAVAAWYTSAALAWLWLQRWGRQHQGVMDR